MGSDVALIVIGFEQKLSRHRSEQWYSRLVVATSRAADLLRYPQSPPSFVVYVHVIVAMIVQLLSNCQVTMGVRFPQDASGSSTTTHPVCPDVPRQLWGARDKLIT